jgi:hypothetical protein
MPFRFLINLKCVFLGLYIRPGISVPYWLKGPEVSSEIYTPPLAKIFRKRSYWKFLFVELIFLADKVLTSRPQNFKEFCLLRKDSFRLPLCLYIYDYARVIKLVNLSFACIKSKLTKPHFVTLYQFETVSPY